MQFSCGEDRGLVVMKPEERIVHIKRAGWLGILANGLLSGMKLIVGFFAGSMALIGDGIDSAVDVLSSALSLFTATLIQQPPDNEHPYGHARAEAVTSKIFAFLIFFAGSQLALSSVKQLLSGELRAVPELSALCAALISIVVKALLSLYKYRLGKRVNSSMLIADAKNMGGDVMISTAVVLGVLLSRLSGWGLVDPIVALLVSLWIMKLAFGIFLEAGDELMDGLNDPDLYRKVFNAVSGVKGAGNPHKTRIRKLGNAYMIDIDIEVDGNLSVREGHRIIMQVEEAIHQALDNVYDVQAHMEPAGNRESGERFGLCRENLDNE